MDDARSANYGQGVLAFRFSPRQCTFSSRAEVEDKRDREGNKPLKWRFPYTWEVSLSNNYVLLKPCKYFIKENKFVTEI